MGTRTVRPPRVSSITVSCTGALSPPAEVAITSSSRSPRAVSGMRPPPTTSPVTVTALDTLLTRLTMAWGAMALPVSRSTMVASTCGGVWPATLTRPA